MRDLRERFYMSESKLFGEHITAIVEDLAECIPKVGLHDKLIRGM